MIQSVVGIGGMGAVYRARDLHFPNVSKWVAVKEMVNQARNTLVRETIVRNFEREANLLATLEHPSIPRIYDYFTLDERSYLVLEFINGKDLDTLLKENSDLITELRAVQWAGELCDVLHFLHTHQPEAIVFRDMKPSNIMINPHGHVVLIDFGIAKPFQAGQRGTMIGTEGYSPPEQYRGEANHLADIYALGATLHHLLTRQDPRLEPPFSFGERPICALNPRVPAQLEAVISTALQYRPEDRFQSVLAMKEALLQAIRDSGELTPALKTSVSPPSKISSVRPIWQFESEDEIRGTPTYHNGVVYVGSYDHNLYALEADSGRFLWKYPADAGIVSRPAVHEGNLYFGSEDHRLHVIAQRNGKLNWTYYTKGPVRSSPYIAEGHVFIGSDDGSLHAVNTLNGRKAWQIEAGGAVRSTPVVSQEQVYFGTEGGELFCMDFRGAVRWRFQAKRAITSSPIVWQGVVYFASVDATLYALDAKTGWILWRFRLGRASISTPCLAEELIFAGAADGNIYAVDLRTAKESWRFTTDHQVSGSPVIYKDSLYCGSVDGCLYCLEYRTGRLRWKVQTDGPITGSPAAADDRIFIGSTDHRLYAVQA
jgi:outer membrane protein assembly factor BamB/tRNA A-37 threonylcarbamoyl transferase component Bud32